MIYILSFYICCQIEAILKIVKIREKFKTDENLSSGEHFCHKCHRK